MGIQVTITYPVVKNTTWRVYHDFEMAKLGIKPLWRPGMPEVHPLYPNHHSPFQEWAQRASYALNPFLTKELWSKVYDDGYWMTNDQGFFNDSDPRANYVTGTNLTKELPRVEALVCGGSMVEGERVGDWVKVNGLHFSDPVSTEYLKANPQFWIRGIFVGGTGAVFRMLGDKYQGQATIHPLIVNRDKGNLYIEANKLQKWTSYTPPNPLAFYL